MKILILFLLPLFTMAQETTTDKFTTDSVLIITGSKDSLFSKSKLWFSNITNAGATPYQLVDKEAGSIVCPVRFQFTSDNYYTQKRKIVKGGKSVVEGGAKVKIFVKDGKVKIVVTDLLYYDRDFQENSIPSMVSWASQNLNNKDDWMQERAYQYMAMAESIVQYSHGLIKNYADYLNKKSETDF